MGCGEWSVYRGRPNSVLLRSAGFADPVADAEIIRLRAELAAMAEAYAEYRRRVYLMVAQMIAYDADAQ